MSGTLAATTPIIQAPALDVQLERAKPDVQRFVMLALPLALLLLVFKVYRLEQPAFFNLACLVFGGFAVTYWLPFRFKENFVILLSLAGAFILLDPKVAALLVATGLALFGIIRSGVAFRWRLLTLLAIAAVFAYGRSTGRFPISGSFWPVFGGIFTLRMIIYLYDVKYQTTPPRLKDYLSYFFILPNYYFSLFPVIDFQTMRKSFFQRDIHPVAQQGIWWIFRGTTHLLLYRVIYQMQAVFSPPKVSVQVAVVAKIILAYLLYIRVTGQFHIIAGMLHLFGYDLPETNHRYLLARSMNDYWRRGNIYWKNFMVKICYLPAYFKLRRGGELRAQLLAIGCVVVTTWFLHAYQFFWLRNQFLVTAKDIVFWCFLGSMMLVNTWVESKQKKRAPQTGWKAMLRQSLQVAGMFSLIAFFWSMWSSDSLTEWVHFLRSGNI